MRVPGFLFREISKRPVPILRSKSPEAEHVGLPQQYEHLHRPGPIRWLAVQLGQLIGIFGGGRQDE